jgi:membrane-associated phospholipid phosphatase
MAYRMPLKAVGTTVFMFVFFQAYFAVLRNPSSAVTEMPLLAIDAWIPVWGAAFPVYASLWVYVSLPAALLREFRPLILFGIWIGALCLFCLGIFWLWPTAVPATGIDWRLYPEMAMIKGVDASGNACPSLHVASAVFAAIWLTRIARDMGAGRLVPGLIWLHCLAILWSTLATRQHVALDVIAGTVVGAAFGVAGLRHALRHASAGGL